MCIEHRKIHIKIADSGWILEKCALEIAKRSKNVTFSTESDPQAKLQYYMNYSARRSCENSYEAAFFTHPEIDAGARERFFSTAKQVDLCICMSRRYADELKDFGIENVEIISPGVDLELFRPKIRIGIVGRTYHTGRKGENLVAQVMDISEIEWRFTGSGWPGASTYVSEGRMPDFYNDLDYVLIPSLYEGGPMSALEGLACGVPIISSDVGWMDSHPHISFENGNVSSLRSVLLDIVKERMELRHSVSDASWDNWADKHIELFDKILSKQQTRPRTSNALPAAKKSSIVIVSHGSENTTKGGPTTRISNIVEAAASNDVSIEVKNTIKDDTAVKRSIVHVFNSWPLESAVAELRWAKEIGATVVYSPIALNLQFHKYYDHALKNLLKTCVSSQQLDEGIGAVWQLTRSYSRLAKYPPAEGVDGHFAALKEGVSLADHVIFLSEYEQDFLASFGAVPSSSTIVKNGVDTRIMTRGNPSAFQNTYGLSDFVLVVGRIESRKNQALIAYALRDLDRPIVFIGHIGDEEYFQLVKRWAGPNFIHIDRIEDREVLAGAYKAAVCVVLASWAEGAPLTALEAAAAATPLVLSETSGEREYFGENAQYVHPCDTVGIKDAVVRAIDWGRSQEHPEEFALQCGKQFDISVHAANTLSVYKAEEAKKVDKNERFSQKGNRTALDNTHLSHHLMRTDILTGVTNVEYHLSRALVDQQPDIHSFVWDGQSRSYLETTLHTILTAEKPLEQIRSDNALTGGRQVKLESVAVRVPQLNQQISTKRYVFSTFKQLLSALPRPVNRLALRVIRFVRPNFEPTVLPEHKVFGPSPASRVAVTPTFRQILVGEVSLNRGDRLILLGQPWISNDRMLEDLCSLVRRKGLKLWAHVPDIVYVTDSDTFDNDTRQAYRQRLEKLLGVVDTAVVISNQAEREINQFSALNSLNIKTRRIRLSISDTMYSRTMKKPDFIIPSRFAMYVASINSRKRHLFLIDAWKDMRRLVGSDFEDVGLILVGSPQAGFSKFREARYKAQLQRENIYLLEGLNDREVAWLYNECMFTVYPAKVEGWGIPPVESLHFGKPCLVTDTIPSAEEISCSALVKLPANDYFAWVNALVTLIANSEMRKRLSEEAESFEVSLWDDAAHVLLFDS